jgi:hypothetical protein
MIHEHNDDFGITFIASSVIICYGTFIYLLLSIVNINAENIILASILISSCIVTYDLTIRFCDIMFELLKKKKYVKDIP